MEDNTISDLVFKQLLAVSDNQKCFDCGANSPQWASINNGVFICLTCAGTHRSLGVHISSVRSITMDKWTEVQLKSMHIGGNERLAKFFSNYDLQEESIEVKYKTKASDYYRNQIRNEITGNNMEPMEKPSYDDGRETLVFKEKSAEEIMANNPPYQGANTNLMNASMADYQKAASQTFTNMWGSLSQMSSYAAKKASETNQNYITPGLTTASAKISENIPDQVKTNASQLSEKMTTAAKSTSESAYNYATSTSSNMYSYVNQSVTSTTEQTKQTYNERGVQGIAEDTASGAKKMSYSAWNMLSSVSSSLAQKVSEKMDEAVEATLGDEYHQQKREMQMERDLMNQINDSNMQYEESKDGEQLLQPQNAQQKMNEPDDFDLVEDTGRQEDEAQNQPQQQQDADLLKL